MRGETLLIGGPDGGKSTFTGGLIYYLREEADVDNDIEFLYNTETITNDIYRGMVESERGEYPEKTEAGEYDRRPLFHRR